MLNKLTKLEKMAKKSSFGPDFGPFGPNSGFRFFFSKILPSQSLDIRSAIPMYNIRKKTNYPILRKLGDRQLDGQRGPE